MYIVILAVVGLILGSFVNALVWRVYVQEELDSKDSKTKKLPTKKEVSITKGRSMCPHCHHTLSTKDLIPVLSWVLLKGKCRYCHKAIGWQYPVVELTTALLFVASYLFWPAEWDRNGIVNFISWLIVLTGFMALIVYDIRWMLLPNRIVYPLLGFALILAMFNVLVAENPWGKLLATAVSVAVAGGIFYLLFLISNGRWIGGGDVKLGALIGLILADPAHSFLMLLTASILGTLFVLPGLLLKRVTPTSRIPFGPFLIIAAIIVKLFGASLISWYERTLLLTV